MMYSGHILKSLSLLAILAVAGCAGQPPASKTPSGTYSVTYDNLSALLGVHSGTGRLVLPDGSEYAFKADGYSLAGLGHSIATATGTVYNLQKPEDLSGEYGAVGGTAIVGHGGGTAGLKNRENEVYLDVDSAETGLRLGLGGGFVTFRLGEQLKGPRVAAVQPMPPNLARQTGYIQCCRACGYCRHGPLQRQAFETACRERQTSADTTRHSGEPYHRHRRWRGRPCSSDTGKHAAPCEQARRDHDYRHQVTRTGRQAFANPYPGPGRLPGYHDRKPRPATGRGFFVPPRRSCLAEMRT